MSGGHFQYSCHIFNNFACDLESELKKDNQKLHLEIPDDIREQLQKAAKKFKEFSEMAHDIEWYFSGDYGDDTFREEMKKWPKL